MRRVFSWLKVGALSVRVRFVESVSLRKTRGSIGVVRVDDDDISVVTTRTSTNTSSKERDCSNFIFLVFSNKIKSKESLKMLCFCVFFKKKNEHFGLKNKKN